MYYYYKIAPTIYFYAIYFYLPILVHSNIFYNTTDGAYLYALVIQVLSWIIQILSHKFIEKNQPAFIDGLTQSVLVAPLFIIYEMKQIIKKNEN